MSVVTCRKSGLWEFGIEIDINRQVLRISLRRYRYLRVGVVCGEFQKETGPKVSDLVIYMKIGGDLEGGKLWVWKGVKRQRRWCKKCWIRGWPDGGRCGLR